MKNKLPTSLRIFIAVITLTVLVFLTATGFSYFQVDKKYAMILAFFMFVGLTFSTVGIYAGVRHQSELRKSKLQNRVGLTGNLLIFLFTIALMAYAAISQAR